MNITDSLVDYIQRLAKKKLPDEVFHQVNRCLIDYFACLYAGSRQSAYLGGAAQSQHAQNERFARVFGTNSKASPEMAALLNAISAHTIEFDDGHRRAMMHLGAPVFSSLLAAWDVEACTDFERLAQGAVCGYQTAIILAGSLQPSHKKRGFHGTGTCGVVGAAVGVAVMLGYSDDQLKSTISLAATSASGLLEMIDDGSQMKPYNAGHAAMAAYVAALLGKSTPVSPHDPIGGKRGFLSVLAGPDGYRTPALLSDHYLIMDIYTKPYAACRHCHPPIEAAERLVGEYQLKSEEICSVKIKTYDLAVFGHDATSDYNVSSAKMSTPFGVASLFCGNGAGLLSFEESAVLRDDICSLASRISVVEDSELTSQLPEKRGCIMEVTRNDGVVLTCRIDYPKGEPENPMSDAELEGKFKELVSFSEFYEERTIDALVAGLWNIDKSRVIDELR